MPSSLEDRLAAYQDTANRPPRAIARGSEKLAAAVNEFRAEVADWRRASERYDKDYLAESGWLDEKIADAREGLKATIEKIQGQADRQLERARDAAEPKLPSDPHEAQLAEVQRARAWDRVKALLEFDADPITIAERFADRGDLNGLRALIEELPAFLEAHRAAGESLDTVDRRTAKYLAAIREIETPALPDKQRARREALTKAEEAHSLLQTNAQFAQREAKGIEPVPAFEGVDGPIHLEEAA